MRKKIFFSPFFTAHLLLLCLMLAVFPFSSNILPSPVSAAPARSSAAPEIGGCPAFPANNIWNRPVNQLPLDSHSAAYINSIGSSTTLHPDFGSQLWDGGPIGIPYNLVPGTQPKVGVSFYYPTQSDAGPYPIPTNAQREWGSDHHILVIDQDNCRLYETYDTSLPAGDGSRSAGSGAIYDLNSNALRPDSWTSADAAGLPIFPGLARCEEVEAGLIAHALRFTANETQMKYVWPARHYASSNTDAGVPPMGQRFRLKSSFSTAGFSTQTQVLLQAMKTYGLILADNGSDWYISGAPGSCWNDDTLVTELRRVHGSDFEAVDSSSLMLDPNSGQARILNLIPRLWLAFITRA